MFLRGGDGSGSRVHFPNVITFRPPQGIRRKHSHTTASHWGPGAKPRRGVQGRREPLPHAAQAHASERLTP